MTAPPAPSACAPVAVIPSGLLPAKLPPPPGIAVHGHHRAGEGLVQVLATAAREGLARVGHAHAGGPCSRGLCVTPRGVFLDGARLERRTVSPLRNAGRRNGRGLDLSAARVALVGAGSVGGGLALGLAQAGIRHLTVVDPDIVDTPNLARTVYRIDDLGRRKVDALAERLAGVAPGIEAEARAEPFAELPPCDLLVASTDDAATQLQASRLAHALDVPALFAGCHARAVSGEVLWMRPGATACYACTFRRLRGVAPARRSTPYLSGARPRPELALGVDVQRLVSVALAYALALLGDRRRRALVADPERNLVLVQSGQAPTATSRKMRLAAPFAMTVAVNRRDPECPQCGREGARFAAAQRTLVGTLLAEAERG